MLKLKIYKNRLLLSIIVLICLILIIHFTTYGIDARLIALDKAPKFCVITGRLKDGGTTLYYGVGYQIIKWNMLSSKNVEGKIIHGIEHGYEIHRFPFYRDWTEGPTIQLEFR